jgi:predicted dehydrogenase
MSLTKPRLGFIGLGWIGRLRMQALAEAQTAQLCAYFEPSDEAAALVHEWAPEAQRMNTLLCN